MIEAHPYPERASMRARRFLSRFPITMLPQQKPFSQHKVGGIGNRSHCFTAVQR